MIEIKLVFSTFAEASAFLSTRAGATTATQGDTGSPKPETAKAKTDPKPVKTEPAADTKPTAVPTQATKTADAPAAPKIEYAPLGEKITALVAAGKAPALKELFATLKPIDGVEAVKKGSQVHADDLGKLKEGLDKIEAADAMS